MATTAAEPIFVDTNVLIRANIASAPLHNEARAALERFQDAGSPLWISAQVLREYLVNVTRPQTYATPLPPVVAVARARQFAAAFHVATNAHDTSRRLLELIERFDVKGKPVHDANIVATMLAHGIKQLLTHNAADFERYGALIILTSLI